MEFRRFDVHQDPLHFGSAEKFKTISSKVLILGCSNPGDFPALIKEQLGEIASVSVFFNDPKQTWNVAELLEKNHIQANGIVRPEEKALSALIEAIQADLGSIVVQTVFVELELASRAVKRFRILADENQRSRVIFVPTEEPKLILQYEVAQLIAAIEAKF